MVIATSKATTTAAPVAKTLVSTVAVKTKIAAAAPSASKAVVAKIGVKLTSAALRR